MCVCVCVRVRVMCEIVLVVFSGREGGRGREDGEVPDQTRPSQPERVVWERGGEGVREGKSKGTNKVVPDDSPVETRTRGRPVEREGGLRRLRGREGGRATRVYSTHPKEEHGGHREDDCKIPRHQLSQREGQGLGRQGIEQQERDQEQVAVGEEGKEDSSVLLLRCGAYTLLYFQVESVQREQADGQPAGQSREQDA